MRTSLLLLLSLLAGAPHAGSSGLAPHTGSSGLEPQVGSSGSEPSRQEGLEAQALRFAGAWTEGDLRGLEAMMASKGVRLQVQGEEHVSIPPRQAGAALRSFRDRYSPGATQVWRVVPAEGNPAEGFGELRWRTAAPGSAEAVIFTFFVAFALEEGVWRVTEIRVLFRW